jgi:hypothetical protein
VIEERGLKRSCFLFWKMTASSNYTISYREFRAVHDFVMTAFGRVFTTLIKPLQNSTYNRFFYGYNFCLSSG